MREGVQLAGWTADGAAAAARPVEVTRTRRVSIGKAEENKKKRIPDLQSPGFEEGGGEGEIRIRAQDEWLRALSDWGRETGGVGEIWNSTE